MFRRLGGTAAVVMALALSSVAASTARAEEDPEALIRQGNALRKRGDDARAYGYFKRAYETARTPRSAAQLGLVEQALAYFLDAETHLTEALAARDPWVRSNHATLEASRTAVRARLGKLELRGAPSNATATIGDRAGVAVPADGIVWATPDETSLQVTAPGYVTFAKHVSITAGATLAVAVEMATLAARAKAEEKEMATTTVATTRETPPEADLSATARPATGDGGSLRVAGIVTGGAGVVLTGVGVLLYLSGKNKADAINDAPANQPYDPANGNYKTLGNAGIAMMIGGVAAVATGVTLYLVGQSRDAPSGVTQAGISPIPGGGWNVSLTGRF